MPALALHGRAVQNDQIAGRQNEIVHVAGEVQRHRGGFFARAVGAEVVEHQGRTPGEGRRADVPEIAVLIGMRMRRKRHAAQIGIEFQQAQGFQTLGVYPVRRAGLPQGQQFTAQRRQVLGHARKAQLPRGAAPWRPDSPAATGWPPRPSDPEETLACARLAHPDGNL